MNRDQYIFFHSYLDIPLVLQLAEESLKNNNHTIFIVTKAQLVKILRKIFKKDKSKQILFLDVPVRKCLLLNQLEERRYLKKALSTELTKGNADVYFFSKYYSYLEYFVLEKLKTIPGNMIYYCFDPKIKFSVDKTTFKSLIYSQIFKLIFGNNISIKAKGTQLVSVMEDEFFHDIEIISKETIDKRANNMAKYFIDYDFQIIFFFSKLDNFEFINFDSVSVLVSKIMEDLKSNNISSNAVGVKYHPMQGNKLFYQELKNEIPAYIPAQIIRLNSAKIIFSIFSASLFSELYSDTVKISLIELVEWNNYETYLHMKAYLLANCKKNIFFPKSFEELKEIIKEKLWENLK